MYISHFNFKCDAYYDHKILAIFFSNFQFMAQAPCKTEMEWYKQNCPVAARMQQGFLKGRHRANWPAVNITRPSYFQHLNQFQYTEKGRAC